MTSGDPERRTRRRRWPWILLGAMAVLALAIRVTLPMVVRSVLAAEGTAALAGDLTVGDVDVSLLRGWVGLEDVALRASGSQPDDQPLVSLARLWVNVGWLDLWNKRVALQDVGLEGLRMNVDRLAGGEIVLPTLRHSDAPAPDGPGEEVEAEHAEPWAIVLERLTFEDGALRFEDHVVDPPEERRLVLPSLRLADLWLQPSPDSDAGRGRIRIELRDGSIELRTRVVAVQDGFEITARMEVEHLPLDRVHVHLPELGWSGSTGRLDAVVSVRVTPTHPLAAHGQIELSDVGIEVVGEDAPVLAWRRLEVDAERVDLAERHASIRGVALDGGRVLVRPTASVPLPVLPGDRSANGASAPPPTAAGGEAAAEPAAWTWEVATVTVKDTQATVLLEPPPLAVDVRALKVTGLSSESGSEARLAAEVGLADGTVGLNGDLRVDPPGGTLSVTLSDLDVGRLAAASGALPLPLRATVRGDVEVQARADPLVLTGTVELADVETKIDDGDEFLVAWKRLAVAIRTVALGGVLPLGAANGAPDVGVELAGVELVEPRVVATRTADGFVLPPMKPAGGAATADAGPSEAATAVAAVEPEAEGGDVTLVIDRLSIDGGDVRFTDRSVSPPYRGRLARLDVDARGIRVPANRLDRISLSTRVDDTAPIEVTSVQQGDAVTVSGTIRDVRLSPFNPYVVPFGYRIGAGTFSLDSETTLRSSAYDSDNRIALRQLAVSGAEGDALFRQTFGVSLSVALALLKDLEGTIALGVPVAGDRETGTSVAIGPIVREALTRAILGALTSPLKLLGAVRLGKGKIESFEPAPIAFVPGTAEIAPGAREQAQQFARALAQVPNITIRIVGRTGEHDVRALSERSVLAELEDEGGFVGGMRNLFSGGTRAEVRDALRARAEGESGALDGDAAEQLDAWVAQHPVDDARLGRLARDRAAHFHEMLREAGARPGQVVVGEPAADRIEGVAEVDVQLVTDALGEAVPDT